MTTIFQDNKICTFRILLSWRYPRKKKSVFGRFSSLPPRPTPFKNANFIFIVVLPSLTFFRAPENKDFPFSCVGQPRAEPYPKPSPCRSPFALPERVDLRTQKEGILGKKTAWGRKGTFRPKSTQGQFCLDNQ